MTLLFVIDFDTLTIGFALRFQKIFVFIFKLAKVCLRWLHAIEVHPQNFCYKEQSN